MPVSSLSVFSNAALSQLTNEKGILCDFLSLKLDSQFEKAVSSHAYIVILAKSFAVKVFSTIDDDNVQTFLDFSTNTDLLFGWRMFSDMESARRLSLMLESIDRTSPLPPFPVVLNHNAPDQFPLSFDSENCAKIGTMMHMEDVAAETAAVETAYLSDELDGLKKPPAISKPKCYSAYNNMSPNRNQSISWNPSSPYHGVSQGASPGVGNAGMYGSVSGSPPPAPGKIDMSGMKFDFDKKGLETGMGARFLVSHVFPHRVLNVAYVVVFMVAPSQLYYWDSAFMKIFTEHWIKTVGKPKGMHIPSYMTTMGDIATCQPSDPTEYKRSKSGWTVSVPHWIIEMPRHLCRIEDFVMESINTLASNFRESSSVGANFATWLRENKNKVYGIETGETGNKKKIGHDQFVKIIHNRLVKMWTQNTVEYLVPLDRIMMYGHIKELLVNRFGCRHWNELDKDFKQAIISKWQVVPYPDWDETEVKPYRKE